VTETDKKMIKNEQFGAEITQLAFLLHICSLKVVLILLINTFHSFNYRLCLC